MKFLETPEEKKSFTVTSVIFVILFLLFTIFGLTYMDPPPENGIAVNFGTTDTGEWRNTTNRACTNVSRSSKG